MDYFLSRSYEIARSTREELEQLHAQEKKSRCLQSWEIQEMLKRGTLRDHWAIPDDQSHQMRHNERVKQELKALGIAPVRDFFLNDMEAVHKFDLDVLDAVEKCQIDFNYSDRKRGVALRDSLALCILAVGILVR